MAESLESVLKAFAKIKTVDELPYWQQEARRLLKEKPNCHWLVKCNPEQYGSSSCDCKSMKLADFA